MLFRNRRVLILWQFAVLFLGTTWLLAPYLNHIISYRTGLISQFELPGQPYSWFFRTCDALAALLIALAGFSFLKNKGKRIGALLVMVVGLGLFADPVLSTTCHIVNGICIEYISAPFILHAIETVITSITVFGLATYDARKRKKLFSTMFVAFQLAYGVLFLTQLASQDRFNTLAQFAYEMSLIVWLVWYVRDFLAEEASGRELLHSKFIKQAVAAWAFLNGLASIVISLADISIIGKLRGLYFAGDNAWLAQHGMIVGVVLIYISRHLLRGERRARHIFMLLSLFEILKYSVITPNPGLLFLYFLTFAGLFVIKDAFNRGPLYLTWRLRLRELAFIVVSLAFAGIVVLLVLHSSNHKAEVINRSFDNFFDYTLRGDIKKTHLESILLAHAFSAFLLSSVLLVLWILFRPARPRYLGQGSQQKIIDILNNSSNSSEDFFKLWPADKSYFFGNQGFIAYKLSGPIAFALADPIAENGLAQKKLLDQFIEMCRNHGWRACFLPVTEANLSLYHKAQLNSLQIGSSSVINTSRFQSVTIKDKWWRWQKNRAEKQGYLYAYSLSPHSPELISDLRTVSDSWLGKDGREERSFALGYFDEDYLEKCKIHYLIQSDQVAAFTNEIPVYNDQKRTSVDLMRHRADANNAMPYLLSKTIVAAGEMGYKEFDLGFVPFAATKAPIIRIIKALTGGRFSSSGLEQFKNKFDPVWEPNYLAYDGDIADLALIAINLEKVMSVDLATT